MPRKSAIYNVPLEAINFRKRLKDELQIEIIGTAPYLPQDFEPESIVIDDGEYTILGDNTLEADAKSWGKALLQGFRIGKYPLTNGDFAKYIDEHKNFDTRLIGWQSNTPPEGTERLPVKGVTYFEAVDYCNWLTEKLRTSMVTVTVCRARRSGKKPPGATMAGFPLGK